MYQKISEDRYEKREENITRAEFEVQPNSRFTLKQLVNKGTGIVYECTFSSSAFTYCTLYPFPYKVTHISQFMWSTEQLTTWKTFALFSLSPDTRNLSECSVNKFNTTDSDDLTSIEELKCITYELVWLVICAVGIVGNVMNLIVLSQPNMKGTAYIYMRG